MTSPKHPVTDLAERLLRVAPDGKVGIDPKAEGLLSAALEKHGADPEIAQVVIGCFDLAMGLFQAGAGEAAAVVLKALAQARPHITGLVSFDAAARDRLEAAAPKTGDLAARAPLIDGAAPQGSLKASAFLNPGRQSAR